MSAVLELNHVALLQDRAQTSGGTILLKLPKPGCPEWIDVTVAEFAAEVDRVAGVLASELQSNGVSPGSVVGVLVKGRDYLHLVYTIALSRASYVPQMIPISILVDMGIIVELLHKAEAKAIVYDPSFDCSVVDLPKIPVTALDTISSHNASALPQVEELPTYSDICFIYLTSGSTSGTPKLVPLTQQFISTYYKAQFDIWLQDRKLEAQDVLLKRGSICSVAPMIQYLGCLYTRSCIVYPATETPSTQDLFTMVDVCGLNHMGLYGTYLSPYIQAAKRDPGVLKLLQGMRSISYGGVPVSIAEDDWCFENGISLIVRRRSYVSCPGLLMSSVHGKPARYIRPLPSVSCRFDPGEDTETDGELFEFILLADSPQIPKPHLLSADGIFHSGDLFERQLDGSYLFRGRADDWIKTSSADCVDAKSIEEKVHETCSDLVKDCIVVGSLRPSPALFIELHESCREGHESVKQNILERMHEFNIRRYTSERVTDGRLILVVEGGVLPRTMKGNLRRAAIERQYSAQLDEVYASLST